MLNIFYFVVCVLTHSSLIFISAIDINDYKLTIIHANDLLSAFAGVNNHNTLCDLNTDKKDCIGGADKIVSKIREFRAKEQVLFVNVGNNLGGFWFNHFGSPVVIDFMRKLQFDVITLGISDYAFNDYMTDSEDYYKDSYNNLTQFISDASLVSRLVSCNVDVDTKYISNFYSNVRKSTRLLIGNRKVGVIGFVKKPNDVNIYSQKRDRPNRVLAFDSVKINDPIKCLQEEAENLRKDGIDIIVAIGSGNDDYFKEIASNVSNIDVVIGSYAESKNSNQVIERSSHSYPNFLVNGNPGDVIVVTADVLGKSIGKISITFDKKGLIKSNEGILIKLDDSVQSDPNTRQLIDKYQRSLIIGTTNVFLNGSHCNVEECNLGNVIADSLVFYRVNYINDSFIETSIEENGNDMLKSSMNQVRDVIGLINGESISNSIGSINRKEYFITKVSLDHVFLKTNQRDENDIKLYILNGKTIRDLLEENLSKSQSYPLLQVSGIKLVYDLSKPVNERITEVLVKCTLCSGETYNDLNDTKFYDVLLPQSIKIESDTNSLEVMQELKVYDIVEQYIKENSPINTVLEQRITITGRNAKNRSNGKVSAQSLALFFALICFLFI